MISSPIVTDPTGEDAWLSRAPSHWVRCAPKYMMRSASGGNAIKGDCSPEPFEGGFQGFSASGPDVWLDEPQFRRPGIVLSAVGAQCGKTFKADGEWGVVANTHCLLPLPNADRDFLWYVTNLPNWWEKGGSAQPFVKVQDTLSRKWAFPPLPEQQAIAYVLDRETAKIDALISKQEELIQRIEEHRRALISHAVVFGTDPSVSIKPSGCEWFHQIPVHWKAARLKHVASGLSVGVVITPSKYYAESGIPALRSLNVCEMELGVGELVFFSEESNELLSKSKLREGDLVAVRTGKPGTTAVVGPEFDGANCIDLIIVRRSHRMHSRYMAYVMNSDLARAQYAAGSEGAIQQHFNIETAGDLAVPVPPVVEQEAISDSLDVKTAELARLSERASDMMRGLHEHRSALITAAVTGQIEVPTKIAAKAVA